MIIKAGNHYINTEDIAYAKSCYTGTLDIFFLSTKDRFMDNHLCLTKEEALEFDLAMIDVLQAPTFTPIKP